MTEMTSVNLQKQTLIPVKVPWRVVPSTPLLHLSVAENDDAVVRFAAHFGLEHSTNDQAESAGSESAEIVASGSLNQATPGDRRAPYKVVKATFIACPWVRLLPSFSGSSVIDEATYDMGAITSHILTGESFDVWSRRFDEMWLGTSICPDPRFYEVENSSWVTETGAARYGMKHYLIKGHDGYVEVIAGQWSWEVEGILEGW